MERNEKIVYHATNAYIHLRALIDLKVSGLSTISEATLMDATQLTDEIVKRTYTQM